MATASSILAKLDTAIEAMIDGKPVQSYQISTGGTTRNIEYMTMEELLKARKYFALLAANEDRGNGVTYGGFNRVS